MAVQTGSLPSIVLRVTVRPPDATVVATAVATVVVAMVVVATDNFCVSLLLYMQRA